MRIVTQALMFFVLVSVLVDPARAQMQPAVSQTSVESLDASRVEVAWDGGTSIKEMSMKQLLLVGLGAAAGAMTVQTFLAGVGGQLATVAGLIIGALAGNRIYEEYYGGTTLF